MSDAGKGPSPAAKLLAYEHAHETAKELGYPSLTEALEALDEYQSASPSGQLRKAVEAWAWIDKRDLDLTFDYPDEEGGEGEWRVYRISGNINDREWDVIGSGATPLEAVTNAMDAAEAYASLTEGEKA